MGDQRDYSQVADWSLSVFMTVVPNGDRGLGSIGTLVLVCTVASAVCVCVCVCVWWNIVCSDLPMQVEVQHMCMHAHKHCSKPPTSWYVWYWLHTVCNFVTRKLWLFSERCSSLISNSWIYRSYSFCQKKRCCHFESHNMFTINYWPTSFMGYMSMS